MRYQKKVKRTFMNAQYGAISGYEMSQILQSVRPELEHGLFFNFFAGDCSFKGHAYIWCMRDRLMLTIDVCLVQSDLVFCTRRSTEDER